MIAVPPVITLEGDLAVLIRPSDFISFFASLYVVPRGPFVRGSPWTWLGALAGRTTNKSMSCNLVDDGWLMPVASDQLK